MMVYYRANFSGVKQCSGNDGRYLANILSDHFQLQTPEQTPISILTTTTKEDSLLNAMFRRNLRLFLILI